MCKIRLGFVSNSSSSSFILDIRQDGVQKLVNDFHSLDLAEGLSRCTAMAVGESAVWYAKEWNKSIRGYDKPGEEDSAAGGLGNWILEWAEKLGNMNVVFLRESDEEMGGYFPYPIPGNLILSEQEYH